MSNFHIAQLNIAKMKADLEDPLMKGFVDNLDTVNKIADESAGFVWRLETDEGDATSMRVFDDNMLLVNMSVWESIEDLKAFVYNSFHTEILKRKKEWFNKIDSAFQVLWWVDTLGHPTVEEAKQRLSYLQKHSETKYAFSFRKTFEADEEALLLPQ